MATKFTGGIAAAESAIKETLDRRNGGSSKGEFIYLRWDKDNPKYVVRFITDSIVPYMVHNFVKSDVTGKKASYVCRNQEPFGFAECMFCQMVDPEDKKGRNLLARRSIISLAAVREVEQSTDGDGRPVVHLKDVMREIERDGQKVQVPTVGWVDQSPTSFWEPLTNAILLSRTLVDRDWQIIREGERLSTRYRPASYDPIQGFMTEEEVTDHYAQWFPQLKNPLKLISDNLEFRASDEYIERVFFGKNNDEDANVAEPTVSVAAYPGQQTADAAEPQQAPPAPQAAPAPQATPQPSPAPQAASQPVSSPQIEDVPNTAMFRQPGESAPPATGGSLRERLEQGMAAAKK